MTGWHPGLAEGNARAWRERRPAMLRTQGAAMRACRITVTSEMAAEAQRLRAQGLGLHKIARAVGVATQTLWKRADEFGIARRLQEKA